METNQYIEVFLDESREHLQAVNDHLLELEKQPEDTSIVGEIFRSAHTLKGMAATMGFEDISSLTHKMENVLDLIRNDQLVVTTELIDITFNCLETLEEMVESIAEGGDGKKDVSDLVNQLEAIEKGEQPASKESENSSNTVETVTALEVDEYQKTVMDQAKEQGFQSFQVTVTLNEDCMLKQARVFMVFEVLEDLGEVIKTVPSVEELEEEQFDHHFSVLLLTKEEAEEIRSKVMKISEIKQVDLSPFSDRKIEKQENNQKEGTQKEKTQPEKSENNKQQSQKKQAQSKSIRVNIERIDRLMNLFEEVVIDRGRLEDISRKIGHNELIETVEHMSRVSKDMQNMMLTMRMVPIEQVFNRFPRMIRGLAKDLDKKIELEISGAETELDRTVIDEIGDPLVHLIRNSVDHGIESPQERSAKGKPEEGHLQLTAYHNGNHVYIEIEDDGAGINREKVESKAIKNGILTEEEAEKLTDEEVYPLIFSSGFSTAEQVSDISGRGVGLDVVKNTIESLGGQIFITSTPDQGSKFTIQLPLTLSILSAMLVNVQKETYAIPLSFIEETVMLKNDEKMFVNGQAVMDFRGKVVPLVSIQTIFEVPQNIEQNDKQDEAVVVVKKGDKLTGLVVDNFMGQKEVVLKSLGNYFKDVFAISGATILGDGSISLIIDPNALMKG
ncbi:two-component system, chemotaxis family, sensor kinase CheA [Salinibacillus kushneri]|uniref:Chemotaxis protein CheA n=1 Tax=Salinibacillus kushneri TaxID=237682 RepID=A0A1I0ERP1_9BACI|nr:chemotaxis protein CheA [Salinibacillus kushneri]SET47476.1 two-component system, chemotaxis family, sensor kinase CheA [Salinibacillus kushneri]